MVRTSYWLLALFVMVILGGCAANRAAMSEKTRKFSDDVEFLKSQGPLVVLSDSSGKAKVAIAPNLQGRVMTSTATGDDGVSYGWMNRDYFLDAAKGKTNPHFSPYGGEDRIWLGPEGGQFSVFFAKGAPFDADHWFTPRPLDTEPFETVSSDSSEAVFTRRASFTNYSGTRFDVQIHRTVRLMDEPEVWSRLGMKAPAGVHVVAFESSNRIINVGGKDWTKETGLLSIWILGMMNATSQTTVVVPTRPGDVPAVNDDYFGKVPSDRLRTMDGTVYFKADGTYRSKIGVSPQRAKPMFGSYDAKNKILTLCQYSFDEGDTDYVNSAWKIQDNPFGGDVVNSYNDGPPAKGKPQLGRFFEIESSSAAGELKAGQLLKHTHRTMHFQGDESGLDQIAVQTLGVSLNQIQAAFK
jgi:hypothetical protein